MLPEETEAGCQPDKARANKVDFLQSQITTTVRTWR
jgi:hypothetical protein